VHLAKAHRNRENRMWRRSCVSFRALSALTPTAFGLGCTTWKRTYLAPEQVVSQKRPGRVRVSQPIEQSGQAIEILQRTFGRFALGAPGNRVSK
jgi:hypothetical protein